MSESSEDFSCAESDIENLMHLLDTHESESSDGWSDDDDWESYVTLPDGYEIEDDVPADPERYLRKHFLTQTYRNGNCKYEMIWRNKWVINRLCPCGLNVCNKHLIDGDFVKERELRYWNNICKFPKGHEMPGSVREGQELEKLKERYDEGYKITCYGNTYEVQQVCPCGKLFCNFHVFPANVGLEYSFTELATYTRATRGAPASTTLIEPLFRKNRPMTFGEVKAFFDQFELNWEVTITTAKITFKMICRCGKAFDSTPCERCAMKNLRPCHLCGKVRRNRMLKKCHISKKCKKCRGICSDCKAAEISYCQHCKKNVRLDHECVPLLNQHVSFRKNNTYPPLIHSVGQLFGICPDCKETCSYRGYHRHSARRHNDKKPDRWLRDYTKIFCPYCDYYHYDPTNVTGHMKFHSLKKTHPCKFGCGMSFTHGCQETQHRQKVHGGVKPLSTKKIRRVGRKMVSLM